MLQQTQVATVIPYYRRFLRVFPEVRSLARAHLDEVLHLWSGLGYYARARNLHRAAQRIVDVHGGEFPRSFAEVAALPGIGRSTAGAILALAYGERFAILDGNARRVLARYFGIAGSIADRAHRERLWELAARCTPSHSIEAYTQAIMDLGATLCLRRNPACMRCPLTQRCVARRAGRQHEWPEPRRRALRRRRSVFMVVALNERDEVLLERRPERGVWGGLWCLPEFASARQARTFIRASFGGAARLKPLDSIDHGFTHFDLTINPLLARSACVLPLVQDGSRLWCKLGAPERIGLPAPVAALLANLARDAAVRD